MGKKKKHSYSYGQVYILESNIHIHNDKFISGSPTIFAFPREDAGGLSREYVLRIPIVS